ncbi:uncharacterized protein AB675_10777 [Cyphellophora attinorum]|uniref:Calcipressin-like protein n=1 Tax=Cyphellophora attinorum TaxID=1664694 RepID=A0A0N0NMY2_9EURO|nr:uncharacterized protein AB675_10777 [Phialophora attinorum]KPI40878.1 hypothetical protein AB675_10777 [Phialophora attinorum]
MATSPTRPQPSPIDTTIHTPSPPTSSTSTPQTKRSRSALSLDLSTLPPLTSPSPPSNTLLITRLSDPKIFHPASLATIREHISSIAPLNSFSPLKSMHRIIVSFFDDASAIAVRQSVDGTAFSSSNTEPSVAKCYFGEPTPINQETKYLERPDAGRLFFISPPPSPPVGWEMRMEDAPNKSVHAEDLASKLSALTSRLSSSNNNEDVSPIEEQYTADELSQKLKSTHTRKRSTEDMLTTPTSAAPNNNGSSPKKIRSRSSTLIYDPKAHGDSPGYPP